MIRAQRVKICQVAVVVVSVVGSIAWARGQEKLEVPLGPHCVANASQTNVFRATDSILAVEEASADAMACLHELRWSPETFEVRLEKSEAGQGDWLVRFPSARPTGNVTNDLVAMEWYQVKGTAGEAIEGPAAVVVHESGSGMNVGRLIARSLRSRGIHTFMIQLPHYGVRRGASGKPTGEALAEALCQSVVDVRRAHDAVAALPYVDATRISLQGTSLGGFVTATTAGMDHAYHRVFILLAGGDLYGVLSQGKRDAAKVREALLGEDQNEQQMREMLNRIEPLRLAHRMDSEHVWLYSGRFDDVVPPKNSDLLAEAANLSPEHHVKLLANHYTGVIFLPMVTEQMSRLMRD